MPHLTRKAALFLIIAVCGLLTAACSSRGSRGSGMSPEAIEDMAFRLEPAYIVSVNVPSAAAEKVLRGVTASVPLTYGNYDQVAFRSAPGVEQFRPLKGSRAGEQVVVSQVPTTRITFAIAQDVDALRKVIAAVRYSHPYEEPVIQVELGWRSRAKTGGDESNSNRWWNQQKPSTEKRSDPQ